MTEALPGAIEMFQPKVPEVRRCPVCDGEASAPFFELQGVPVSIGRQWPSAEEARDCAKGDISLTFCAECGFIWNSEFDPAALDYDKSYDNSLDHSPVFRCYARDLATRLVETHGLRGRDVVEIGCGKGHFLSLLCQAGCNRGYGFDPSYEAERTPGPLGERLSVIGDYYSEKYRHITGDLVCCRHVFEHIADPVGFLTMIRRSICDRPDTIVYFEVPNVRFILDRLSIWDIIYEHCNYFSIESLGATFTKCGLEISRLEPCYEDQFLGIEARVSDSVPDQMQNGRDMDDLRKTVLAFGSHARKRMSEWRDLVSAFGRESRKAVVWGAGAKAVGFLNMLQVGDEVPFAVDINPHKHGRYLPGTGQQIVSPEFLKEYRPDVVILMNAIYENEVAAQLAQLHVEAEIVRFSRGCA